MSDGLRCKKQKETIGLMGHIIADYPSRDLALSAIDAMASNGVSVIEIQIPFSEPMADGPVFMAANHKALDQGVTVLDSMELMKLVSEKYPQVDFVFMTYLNIVYKLGYKKFIKLAADAGARGVIVPDLPVEYSLEIDSACQEFGLSNIRLIAPNTDDARMRTVLEKANGLVYVVARKGVTGSKTEFSSDLSELLARVRNYTDAPLAVGFGVRSPDDVAALKGMADYAVVGTKAFQVFADEGQAGLSKFWKSLNI